MPPGSFSLDEQQRLRDARAIYTHVRNDTSLSSQQQNVLFLFVYDVQPIATQGLPVSCPSSRPHAFPKTCSPRGYRPNDFQDRFVAEPPGTLARCSCVLVLVVRSRMASTAPATEPVRGHALPRALPTNDDHTTVTCVGPHPRGGPLLVPLAFASFPNQGGAPRVSDAVRTRLSAPMMDQ